VIDDLYAFCDSAGKKMELKFRVLLNDSTQRFYPSYKRTFPGASPAVCWYDLALITHRRFLFQR